MFEERKDSLSISERFFSLVKGFINDAAYPRPGRWKGGEGNITILTMSTRSAEQFLHCSMSSYKETRKFIIMGIEMTFT